MDALTSIWPPVATVLWLVLGCAASGHAIMYKRDPLGAAVWVFISFSFPMVGPWLYWVLGINRIERRASRRLGGREKPFHSLSDIGLHGDTDAAQEVSPHAIESFTALRRIADRVTRLPLLAGNRVTPLHNGEEAYPAMLEAISTARRSITIASYIFDRDDVGRRFVDALEEAARRGVAVHVLVDGIGALGHFSRMGRLLLRSGAEVAVFFPLRFPLGRLRINLRNHRKILVVDGTTGFTGGLNISARHLVGRPSPRRVEDLHFRLDGPVVAELQQTFCDDWYLATDRLLEGDAYFPGLQRMGPASCRAIVSGPDESFEAIHWVMQGALAAARHSVWIVTPYFIPGRALIASLVMASLRGVKVTLVLPGFVDLPYMRWAADAYLWELLIHGIRVIRRPPPFVHTKLMIVDEGWLLFGSANLDRRSFRLNFEFNVEAYDEALARHLAAWLSGLTDRSDIVTLKSLDDRPGWKRLRDGMIKLFSPYL